jgi:regulator of cell morphogenesis and NO signaling
MNLIDPNTPLDQFLFATPEQRRLFDDLGIDTCRDHNRSLAEVCRKHGLDSQTVARMLTALQGTPQQRQAVTLELMALTELCDHLEYTQNHYLLDELARLDKLTRTAAEQEGAETPQLLRIRETFVAFREQFTAHIREEADALFPLIRGLAIDENEALPVRPALKSRLARMENQHNQADEALAELHALAGDGSLRLPVSAGVRTVSDAIVRLEHAIHEQIYKENQVLFPRALAFGGCA